VETTFGEAFGDLIRKKRGQEGLTQKELAIKAFDDESKVRRIVELENGTVKRPHVKTVDALVVYFGITPDELDKCRRHGLFTSTERESIGLSRELLENLAFHFEHDNPDAPDNELIAFLKSKAAETKRLKQRLAQIDGATDARNNQIAAANNAIDIGQFDEADEILAAAEEIQQEERTLKEVRVQSNIRFARGDAALLRGQSSIASAHYKKAAEYFMGFGPDKVAEILAVAAGQIYELERRRLKPSFAEAINLASRALELTSPDSNANGWIRAKYHLALLQQVQARTTEPHSQDLLNESIKNTEDALNKRADINDFDWGNLVVLLGNSYMARAEIGKNTNWEPDIDRRSKYLTTYRATND
jgi:transcriptional regulator with XRE-family HTH domain